MDYTSVDIINANVVLKNRINDFLADQCCTLRTLSQRADIPYDSLKKLANGKIDNPSLGNLLKLAETFHCSLDYLVGRESRFAEKLTLLPQRAITMIEALVDMELSLTALPADHSHEYLPLFIPSGNLQDGMCVDSSHIEVIDIAPYRSIYGEKLMCGLQVTTDAFYPVYTEGDVLLLGRDRQPLFGETGVFLHDGRLYIRILKQGTPPRLMPVNGIGISISFECPDEWQAFGYVLTLFRGAPQ